MKGFQVSEIVVEGSCINEVPPVTDYRLQKMLQKYSMQAIQTDTQDFHKP